MPQLKEWKWVKIQTATGEYQIYLDWSISGKLTISVWDEDYILEGKKEPQEIFGEEIDIDL